MKVLYLIDDATETQASLEEALAAAGLQLLTVPDESEALRAIKSSQVPDAVLVDKALPPLAGLELFRSTRKTMTVPVTRHTGTTSGISSSLMGHFLSMRNFFAKTPEVPLIDPERCESALVALEYWEKVADLIEPPIRLVIQETEQSATDMVMRVKGLDNTATQLVDYLTSTDEDTRGLQTQLQESAAFIRQISQFIEQLPERIKTERKGAEVFIDRVETILTLLEQLVETIKAVNRQINMVAINAVIQAAHAGEKGKGFAIVAEEIRRLATHTGDAAERVTSEIEKIHLDVRFYHEDASKRDFHQDMQEAVKMASSIQKIEENYDDMQQYYKTMVRVVKEYNSRLATEIVETLGSIQYQDVVRQRLERLLVVQDRYRTLLQEAMDGAFALSSPEFRAEAERVLLEYLEQESHHAGAAEDETAPKIELF